MLDIVIWELRAAVRRLARSPAFVAAVVLSLAVGIGADVTMLGVVDALLFRPPAHVRDVDRVMDVRIRTFPDYVDLRDNARAFSGVAAYAPRPYTIVDPHGVTPAAGLMASSTLFPVLGVRPLLGRFYTASEDRPGGPHVVVLGYSLWQRRYGGARSAIGRSLRVAGDLYTIIGVAPQGFTGAGLAPVDLFLPITTTKFDAGREALTSRRYSWLHVVARLASGVSAAQAQAEARVIFERGNAADSAAVRPEPGPRDAEVRPLVRARRELAAANIPVSLWLAGVATVVLLIACANVAGLLLARGVRDRQTLAVRAALGAPRGRLAASLLLESAMLAAAGGAGGLLLSRWGGALIRAYLLTGVAAARAPLDARVLAITLAVTAATILACGLWPALRASHVNAARELAGGGRTASASHARVRRVLLVAQLALALVLVVGAGLFTASLRNAHRVDLGMSLDHVLAVDIHMEGAGYTAARERALVPRILARVATIPGVRMAAVTDANVAPGWMSYGYSVPGRDSVPGRRPLPYPPGLSAVTPGFLATIGTPVLLGRGFVDADRGRRVIIINRRFAHRYWPGESPLGRCVKVGD
ncbi:MAG TPA: ABC transporter permease, partial [Gemmatimonadaceae bacterium]|nr:ABC transporter permease [Gemmatimonadaceae bacterium]